MTYVANDNEYSLGTLMSKCEIFFYCLSPSFCPDDTEDEEKRWLQGKKKVHKVGGADVEVQLRNRDVEEWMYWRENDVGQARENYFTVVTVEYR